MTDFFSTIRSYLADYLPKQKCLSANTIKAHKNALNLLVSYLRKERQIKVDKINFMMFNRQIIIDFLQWLSDVRNCTPSSRNQRLSILRTFFDYAGQLDCMHIALELSVKKIPATKQTKTIVKFLSDDALKTLLQQPNTNKLNGLRDRFFMMLMYDTGARCSELINIKICNLRIDTTHPVVYLRGKRDKIRCVPIMPKTVEHCKNYLRLFHPNACAVSENYLFYVHDSKYPISVATVGAFMKKYGESARDICLEVPERVHPHQLRHTRAIHLYRGGMPLVLVGEYLGHENPATTKIYAYADTEMKRVALQKVDEHRNITPDIVPIWQDDGEMILKLSGLK